MAKDVYKMPRAVYYQCIWLVKDIDRLRKFEAVEQYVSESGNTVFFVDDEEVIRSKDVLLHAGWKLDCIRRALETVPEEYRKNTIESIVYNIPYSDMAHENTWRKWRLAFIRELAKNLKLL